MIPDRINYSESIETVMPNGLKRWRKLEIGGTIQEGETFTQATIDAESKLQSALRTIVGESTPSAEYSSEIKQEMKETNLEAERVEILIDNAETEKELTTYWNSAEKYGLVEMYNKKMEELSFNKK